MEERKELKLGKMTSREIAEWMGISYESYRRNIQKRLEYLTNFASFERYRGGLDIKEIYIPYFIKNLSKEDEYYLNEIKETGNGLSSLSGMTRKLKRDKEEFKDVSEKSLYYRLSKAGVRTFGITSERNSKGIYGTRHYVWAVKVNNFNQYRPMSEEELKIYKEILDKYKEEIRGAANNTSLGIQSYKEGELSTDGLVTLILEEFDFYEEVIKEFNIRTGCLMAKATKHELFEDNFIWD